MRNEITRRLHILCIIAMLIILYMYLYPEPVSATVSVERFKTEYIDIPFFAKSYYDFVTSDLEENINTKYIMNATEKQGIWSKANTGNLIGVSVPVINKDLFNATSIRLNEEIFAESAEVFSHAHISEEYGYTGSELYNSFLNNMDPIMPIALTIGETGMWADTRYTWSSAIYSKLLVSKDVNMGNLHVDNVDTNTYIVMGLSACLGCGSNCTADHTLHYHAVGSNDNDSLGPLQILRHYVEGKGVLVYKCGEMTADLMSWRDNLEYFTHNQVDSFSNPQNWNAGYSIKTPYEMMALLAVAHNTGTAYLKCGSGSVHPGSLWKNANAVYDYCAKLGSQESYVVLESYITKWYDTVILSEDFDEKFVMAGS